MKTTESKYCKCLYFTTNALARKVEKLAIEAWKPVNLSPSHAYLLMMAIEHPTTTGKNLLPKLKSCLAEFYNNYSKILGKQKSAEMVKAIGEFADHLN